MKTVKSKDGSIERRKDAEADKLVKSGKYAFCKKSEWKESVRGGVKQPKPEPVTPKKEGKVEKKVEEKVENKETKTVKGRPRK